MDDQLFRLEMVPRMARTLQVKGAFVFSDNLDIRLPGRIASLLAEGKPTRTLRPSGMRFPYRLDFSCILFVETGRVDSVINTSSYRMNACSVLLVPSGAVLHSIEYQAGTRFLIIAWNSIFISEPGSFWQAISATSLSLQPSSRRRRFISFARSACWESWYICFSSAGGNKSGNNFPSLRFTAPFFP